jgi:hypothetical protein
MGGLTLAEFLTRGIGTVLPDLANLAAAPACRAEYLQD